MSLKSHVFLLRILVGLVSALSGTTHLHAEIEVWLSVKFILKPDGTRPTGDDTDSNTDISTAARFATEVDWGNRALATAARGFKLRAVEFLDIRPAVPSGQPSDYWYNLPARANRQTIETAAVADPTPWGWHSGALNIYVNNTGSGQCSFVGSGSSITLGGTIVEGTLIHEIGHFFNLRHTHADDNSCPGPPVVIGDGDGLPATIADNSCLSTRDSLSQSNFNGRVFAALTPAEQAQVNSSWLNVMSYHQAEQLLTDQMDIWNTNANNARFFACLGRTWFVAPFGSDANPGTEPATPFSTIARALQSREGPNDVILLRSGAYTAPGDRLNVPATYCATRGPVTLFKP